MHISITFSPTIARFASGYSDVFMSDRQSPLISFLRLEGIVSEPSKSYRRAQCLRVFNASREER